MSIKVYIRLKHKRGKKKAEQIWGQNVGQLLSRICKKIAEEDRLLKMWKDTGKKRSTSKFEKSQNEGQETVFQRGEKDMHSKKRIGENEAILS